MECLVCNMKLTGKQQKFCTIKCKNIYNQGYNKDSIYKTQSDRGKTRRIKLVESLGGSCSKCGYHKNSAALNFHHLDESTKSFGITMRECSNNKLDLLLAEAKKCILLCANCHMELHYPDYKMVDPVGLEPTTSRL